MPHLQCVSTAAINIPSHASDTSTSCSSTVDTNSHHPPDQPVVDHPDSGSLTGSSSGSSSSGSSSRRSTTGSADMHLMTAALAAANRNEATSVSKADCPTSVSTATAPAGGQQQPAQARQAAAPLSAGSTGSSSGHTRLSVDEQSSPPVIQSANTMPTVTPPSLSQAALSTYIDNDNIRILNQIFDKLADLDHKLAIVTEYLVSYPGNAMHQQQQQQQHHPHQQQHQQHQQQQQPHPPPNPISLPPTPQQQSAFGPPAPLGLSQPHHHQLPNGMAGLLAAAQHQQEMNNRQQSVIVPSAAATATAWHQPQSAQQGNGTQQQQQQQQQHVPSSNAPLMAPPRKRHASDHHNEPVDAPPPAQLSSNALNDHLSLVAQQQARAEWIAQLLAHNQATHKRLLEDRDSPLVSASSAFVPSNNAGAHLRVPVINEHAIGDWATAVAASCTSTINNDDERLVTTSATLKMEEDESKPDAAGQAAAAAASYAHHAAAAELGIYGKMFSAEAIRRAIEKAARSFDATKPKVFAWQLLRESVSDTELPRVHISLRTFQGETADDLLNRQLVIVRNVVLGTLAYFKWDQLAADQRLVKTKIVLSHLKNNTKVRNWTLREGKTHRDRNSPEVLWRRYAAMLGPAGLAAAGLIATPDSSAVKTDMSGTPSSTDSP